MLEQWEYIESSNPPSLGLGAQDLNHCTKHTHTHTHTLTYMHTLVHAFSHIQAHVQLSYSQHFYHNAIRAKYSYNSSEIYCLIRLSYKCCTKFKYYSWADMVHYGSSICYAVQFDCIKFIPHWESLRPPYMILETCIA